MPSPRPPPPPPIWQLSSHWPENMLCEDHTATLNTQHPCDLTTGASGKAVCSVSLQPFWVTGCHALPLPPYCSAHSSPVSLAGSSSSPRVSPTSWQLHQSPGVWYRPRAGDSRRRCPIPPAPLNSSLLLSPTRLTTTCWTLDVLPLTRLGGASDLPLKRVPPSLSPLSVPQ